LRFLVEMGKGKDDFEVSFNKKKPKLNFGFLQKL